LYALGIATLAAPIIFHLIRRSPRGRVPFSSLIYLTATPPRLTRWSRLENVLLLLLRAIALSLLVAAFTRPFLREEVRFAMGDHQKRRIALLIDTSASMKRGDLFARAKARAREVIAACGPGDEIALFSFDRSTLTLVGFEESARLDSPRRQALAKALVDRLEPTWGGTNLGQALIDAVSALVDTPQSSDSSELVPRRVILISDLQQGSRLDALGDFEWPADVDLELRTISDDGSNACLQTLVEGASSEGVADGRQHRVRVSNDAASRREAFELTWMDEKGAAIGKVTPVYVPPGESRVVRVQRPAAARSSQSLRLSGDTWDFDNVLYITEGVRDSSKVVYIGTDTVEDPSGLLYYLHRAYAGSPERSVEVVSQLPTAGIAWAPRRPPALVVMTAQTTAPNSRELRLYLEQGGALLYVAIAPGRADTLAELAGVIPWDLEEALPEREVMLSDVAFDCALFAPFAAAQFNDFTKIRFWKHRRYVAGTLGENRVLARFEGGDPAVIEKTIGRGTLLLFCSGWQPADSQLARSSKFAPLLAALLPDSGHRTAIAGNHVIGEPISLPIPVPGALKSSSEQLVRKPDGTAVKLSPEKSVFSATDAPGVYTLETPDGNRSFTVNLDPMEGKTAALHVETLEQLGCHVASPTGRQTDRDRLRQIHNIELEERQKLWRFLILAVVGVLFVETLVAGRSGSAGRSGAEAVKS
jgi:hypothetical protein